MDAVALTLSLPDELAERRQTSNLDREDFDIDPEKTYTRDVFLAAIRRLSPAVTSDQVTFGLTEIQARALAADESGVGYFLVAESAQVLRVGCSPSRLRRARLRVALRSRSARSGPSPFRTPGTMGANPVRVGTRLPAWLTIQRPLNRGDGACR